MITKESLEALLAIFERADQAVMDVYNSHSTVVIAKEDSSPLTQADMAAHHILTEALAKLFPEIPVVSEEGDAQANAKNVLSDSFWLVDPLDGTKEFIKRTDHFTICAGLIQDDRPIFGIISAPALGTTYYGGSVMGSYKKQVNKEAHPIHVSAKKQHVILGSLSHPNAATTAYIARHYPHAQVVQVGSQLKLTQIAEGLADAYPRLDSTLRLWDLAAGQAILEGAGGRVTYPDGSDIDYHAQTLKVGDFVAQA